MSEQLELNFSFDPVSSSVPTAEDVKAIIPAGCTLCSRYAKRKNIVVGEGPLTPEVMFVGESPDEDSEALGIPYVGGQDSAILSRIIERAGLSRRSVYVTYLTKCGCSPVKIPECKACGKYLRKEILLLKPKLVVLIGKNCLRYIRGSDWSLKATHGAVFSVDHFSGTKFICVKSFSEIFVDPSVEALIARDVARGVLAVRSKGAVPITRDYIKLDTLDKLDTFMKLSNNFIEFGFDIETTGKSLFWENDIACWAVAWAPGRAAYFPVTRCLWNKGFPDKQPAWSTKEFAQAIEMWKSFFKRAYLILHNGKYDLKIMRSLLNIDEFTYFWDTKISARTIDNTADTALKHQAWAYTDMGGYEEPLERFKSTHGVGFDYSLIHEPVLSDYVCCDADCTLRIKQAHSVKISENGQEFLMHVLNMPLSNLFLDVEYKGVLVDKKHLQEQEVVYASNLTKLEEQIHSLAGEKFDVASTEQLSDILFRKLKLPIIKMTKTRESSDADVLKELRGKHDIIDPLLAYRATATILNNFIKGILKRLDKDSRVHTEYKVGDTDTGRIASANPNLQNAPRDNKDIKKAFIAAPGYVLAELDFSQIEVRVLADLSKDPKLISTLTTGADIHRSMASSVFGIPIDKITEEQRSQAKSAVFGIIYGMHYKTLAEEKGMSVLEAKRVYDAFFSTFSEAHRWMEGVKRYALENRCVRSPFNRIRYLDYIDHPVNSLRSSAERCAINSPIQATGSDIPNIAIIELIKTFPPRPELYEPRMQIHDAVVLEVWEPKLADVLCTAKDILENAVKLAVPTPVGIKVGYNLGQTKKVVSIEKTGLVYKND